MKNETRIKLNAFLDKLAKAYGVQDVRQIFEATPPMGQKLNETIQQSHDFLNRISVVYVDKLIGEVVDLRIPSTVASRTNTTAGKRRNPQLMKDPTGRKYMCLATEFDVGITYELLDLWAGLENFDSEYMKAIRERIALDLILIGIYGEGNAEDSDREANPLLQDLNFGWLYDLKTNHAANFLTGAGDAGTDPITIGEGGVYSNIDQMVYDVGQLIPKELRTGREIAIVGQGLVAKSMNKTLGEWAGRPTEKNAIQVLSKSFGGYESLIVPQFPDNGLLITDPKNMQLYIQRSSVRRFFKEEPEFNRVVDYISENIAYKFARLEGAAAVDATKVEFKG